MAEMKITNKQNTVDLSQESLFDLQCIIKANDIYHAAKNEYRHKQFLAFVSGSSDLGLYYLKDSSSLPIIKRIPWFQSSRKKISCLCFDPHGSWLLIASVDSSLYIVPAKTLVDEYYKEDQKWTTKDITSFSALNAQNSYSRPSALVWWEGVSFDGHTGVLGTEQGELIFINLESGKQVGSTKIEGCIINLSICQDSELGVVTLLITCQSKEQWHLILEKPGHGYIYPLINGESQKPVVPNDDADNDDSKTFPTARSRLRGLKQLSVEKLVILKQKLAETRNRNNLDPMPTARDNSNHENNRSDSNDNKNANKLGLFSNWQTESVKCSITPIAIPNDTHISPQLMRNGRVIYTRYVPSYNHLTIHERSSDISPSHVHRMPENCGNILLTSRFFYVSDTRQRFVSIVSRPLSEIRKKDKSEFNRESIIAKFSFDKSEEVINSIFTLSCSKTDGNNASGNNEKKLYSIAKDVNDLKVHIPSVDACIVVTNLGVYRIVLRGNILTLFMDLILKRRAVEDASKLGIIFGLNVQQLIEYAGDIVLCNRQFGRAMELYSLAGCRLSKSILKFASVGYTSELLGCLVSYSTMPAVSELSESNRIHFSNLCILAFTELTLRATSSHNKSIHKDYLNFLSMNTFYDELFAINIAVQTNMWSVLHHLVVCRGLGPQVSDVLIKALPTFMSKNSNLIQHQNTNGLLMCLSDPSLIQGLLNNPCTAKNHSCFVLAYLSSFQIFILQRLINLYDPTHPAVRPLLLRFKARQKAAARTSFSSQNDSLESSEDLDELGVIIEDIIEVFLQTLLTILQKKQLSNKFNFKYVSFTQLPEIEDVQREKSFGVDFKRRLLSAGFAHTALIRNGNVYTWGNSLQGCLGTGPSISRYSTSQEICIFRRLRIEILSVSCGRCHTLAVTNNGVYAWGSNKYGQIGLGELRESPNPELITSLAQEIIVEAVAGQHHSIAITADGRLFTWGWGVHGQLGHGNTEAKHQPTLVNNLLGVIVRHATAGYAHTVILSADGYVYAFGCSLYGQMGNGRESKCTLPVKVSLLPERITLISTKYFHNLAISCTNQLYVWGANPQVLRLQSKERKVKLHKAKLAASEALEREFAATNAEFSDDRDVESDGNASQSVSEENCGEKEKSASAAILEAEEEESHGHLIPDRVDTSLVRGKIVQISTGYHHSALLTKDGTVYTWGRNLDGQLGTGSNRDVLIPTPLSKQSVEKKMIESTTDTSASSDLDTHSFQKAVKICCGINFTVAIEQGGNVIAWGNNNLAQLGRAPVTPKESEEKLVFKFKSSKRIIRCINPGDRMIVDMKPSQVPNIPVPIISYQTYDIVPFAGMVKPLSYIEHNLSDLTLHYALENFHGLYSTQKILNKCKELKYYQACAKLELLEQNFVESLADQLKALKECNPENLETLTNGTLDETIEENDSNLHQENSKLFEKQLERHLVDTLIETVEKQKIKMPASKSLDSFQILDQELHTFDCQGGSEELCQDSKCEDESNELGLENDFKESKDDSLSSTENSTSQDEIDNESPSSSNYDKSNSHKSTVENNLCANEKILSRNEILAMQYAINVIDFYLNEVTDDNHVSMQNMAATAIDFWKENKFPMKDLERIFDRHMKKIYYALGLLLFGNDITANQLSENLEKNSNARNFGKILSTDLCLKVCSLILDHIGNGKPAIEFIEMLSISMANSYGPPLTGFPGTSENKTPEQMIEGIVSTLSARYSDPRPFIHIKDPDKVSQLLTAEEDSMIFTCGHQFLMSAYHSEAIPRMEAELLQSLPSTAQVLSSILCQSYKPETLCPTCLSQNLKDTAKDIGKR